MKSNDTNNGIGSNIGWKLLERGFSQGISFIISVILARILEPDSFGTVSLIMVFVTLMQIFVDGGMGSVLIQKNNVDEVDYSTVLIFNIILCTVIYGISFFLAPLLSVFYGDTELEKAIRVLSIVILISGVKNIQVSRIAINMEFKKLSIATVIGACVSGFIGIVLATKGFGLYLSLLGTASRH